MQPATRTILYGLRSYRSAGILKTAPSSLVLMALMGLVVTGPIQVQDSPDAVRGYIAASVGGLNNIGGLNNGGLNNLTVPPTDATIPVPAPVAGSGNTPYRYETTEAKRYLGKQLFHDPVRTVRINENQNQPVDLPAGTAFGGELQASDPDIQNLVTQTKQTGGCGSCHIAESAGKAGQQINFNVGGEGRGYTDEKGTFFARRRPRTDILPALRTEPIFSGDVLVDFLSTSELATTRSERCKHRLSASSTPAIWARTASPTTS